MIFKPPKSGWLLFFNSEEAFNITKMSASRLSEIFQTLFVTQRAFFASVKFLASHWSLFSAIPRILLNFKIRSLPAVISWHDASYHSNQLDEAFKHVNFWNASELQKKFVPSRARMFFFYFVIATLHILHPSNWYKYKFFFFAKFIVIRFGR